MFPKPTDNPIEAFKAWLDEAIQHPDIAEPTAMCLATATKEGIPSSRMVLLKEVDERGFVFYTNTESRKGQQLTENPHASITFFWEPLGKQVRVNASVEMVSEEEADTYFATRPKQSQIGAWASKQSRPLDGMKTLLTRAAKYGKKFGLKEVPRPEFWSGYQLIPNRIEFWEKGEFRLHKRLLFEKAEDGWQTTYLYP